MKKLLFALSALIGILSPLSSGGQGVGCYLMVYHKDNTHSIHMAISKDGGSNPTKVIYNGKNVTKVLYRSNPEAEAVQV